MKKILGALLILVLAASASFAQTAPKRTADKTFWFMTAASYASTIADEEVTQYELGSGKFKEANPLLGQSRKTAYPVLLGLTTSSVVGSYFLKKGGSKFWWVPQVVTYNVHGFALGYNLKLGRKK